MHPPKKKLKKPSINTTPPKPKEPPPDDLFSAAMREAGVLERFLLSIPIEVKYACDFYVEPTPTQCIEFSFASRNHFL